MKFNKNAKRCHLLNPMPMIAFLLDSEEGAAKPLLSEKVIGALHVHLYIM